MCDEGQISKFRFIPLDRCLPRQALSRGSLSWAGLPSPASSLHPTTPSLPVTRWGAVCLLPGCWLTPAVAGRPRRPGKVSQGEMEPGPLVFPAIRGCTLSPFSPFLRSLRSLTGVPRTSCLLYVNETAAQTQPPCELCFSVFLSHMPGAYDGPPHLPTRESFCQIVRDLSPHSASLLLVRVPWRAGTRSDWPRYLLQWSV